MPLSTDGLGQGLALVGTQLGLLVLLIGFFAMTRRDKTTRLWAISSLVLASAFLFSNFFFAGMAVTPTLVGCGTLGVVGLWVLIAGTRRYFGRSTPWWTMAVFGGFAAGFAALVFLEAPLALRALLFALGVGAAFGWNSFEMVRGTGRILGADWLVHGGGMVIVLGFFTRAGLVLAGFDLTPGNGTPVNRAVTYIVPVLGVVILYLGLVLSAFGRMLKKRDELASLDELTRLPNRRSFIDAANREYQASCRTGSPLTMMLVDIDRFKEINDTVGHHAGDLVLQAVAQALAATCRTTDFVSRYGGEEFAILCPSTLEDQALILGERLLNAVATLPVPEKLGRIVTISLGLSFFQGCVEGETWETSLRRADTALYQAKRNGRARLEVF